jgi:ankyrin repeat protein
MLVQNGANVNFRYRSNTTPLHPASGYSELEIVRYLVEHGADLDERNEDGDTALHFAVFGKTANAKYLIDSGANVNARNNEGKSPLNYAYEQGEMEIYDYLIAHGAREFTPNPVAQQPAPAPQTNVYVTPPASSSSSSQPSAQQPRRKTFTVLVWYLDNSERKSFPFVETTYTAQEAERNAERKFKTGPIGLKRGVVFLEAVTTNP